MTYPVDQIVSLVKANGQLALNLANIARASGEECLQISGKVASDFAGEFKDFKPGQYPVLKGEAGTALFSNLEKNREETLAKVQAAFEEWQSTWKDVVSDTTGSEELAGKFQDLLQPWSGMFSKAAETATPPEKPKAPDKAVA